MTLSEIKKTARENLSDKWGTSVLLVLVFLLIQFGIGLVYAFLSIIPMLSFISYIGIIVISTPISFGLIFCFLELKKGNNVECIDYFKFGFSNFKRVWCTVGNIFKKMWLYVLLYVVFIFLLVFASVFIGIFSYITHSWMLALIGCFTVLVLIAAYITLLILTVIKSYLYVLAPYILWNNPDISAKEAVEKSELLMKGYRGEYFLLSLSLIGWWFLSLFTFGIGLLWLIPYVQMSYIVFYENRLNEDTLLNKNELEGSKNSAEVEEVTVVEEKTEEVKTDCENSENITETEISDNTNNDNSNNTVTEINEADIEKIDILDDNGNIIK